MEQQNGTAESSSMEQKNGAENGYDKIVVIHQGQNGGVFSPPRGLDFLPTRARKLRRGPWSVIAERGKGCVKARRVVTARWRMDQLSQR